MQRKIETAEAMQGLGESLGCHCPAPMHIYLCGDLGAGKTTFVRGFLQGLGYDGKVKSPTYTLVEPYALSAAEVFHFDLYRLESGEELEHIGFRDYFAGDGIILLEWPEKAADILPSADLVIEIAIQADVRQLELQASSPDAVELLSKIQ